MPELDLGSLFQPRPGSPSTWVLAAVALFAVVLAASLVVHGFRRRLFPGHSLHIRLATRFATVGGAISALALVHLAGRYLDVPYVAMRIWLVVAAIAALAFLGYLVYFSFARYPAMDAAHQVDEARRRFSKPVRAPSSGGARRRSKKHRR